MESIILNARKREAKERSLKNSGLIPAVTYGKGKENSLIFIDSLEFEKVYRAVGTSVIFDVVILGEKKKVIVQEVSKHPLTDRAMHVDFYEVSMKEKITTSVPLKFVGQSAAIADRGGTLMTSKDEIEIECLPKDLPHEIEIDISVLDDFEKAIHISDIQLSDKIEIKDDPSETIASVEPPRSEEELAELEEPVTEKEMPKSDHGEEESPEKSQEKKEE